MDRVELKINGKLVKLYGKKAIIEKEKIIIENLDITGNEFKDRLIIQKCIDDEKLKSNISYDGSTVYPFEKTIKQYRRLQKEDSLENMTEYMYHFFMYACGDIAHYNIHGFRDYYDNKLTNLENQLLKTNWVNTRYSDLDKIFKEIKIGKYFEEREQINIDNISLNTLKSIIRDCGWEININSNGSWKICKNTIYNKEFSFNIDVLDKNISSIVQQILDAKTSFDKENYIENMVANRKETDNPLSISEIVTLSNHINCLLSQFANNVLYKSRIAAEETKDIPIKKNKSDSNVQQLSLFASNNNLVNKNYNDDYEYLEICG